MDYHIAAEPDVSSSANRHIWACFILLGILLFATVGGLVIMYRFQVQDEREMKIGEIDTHESLDQMALQESYLTGKRGLFDGKRHVAIDVAIKQFISDARRRS
jgi:hypothetical protein